MTPAPAQPRDYRASAAYQRSNRARPDGRPVWPLGADDLPSHFSRTNRLQTGADQ